MENKHKKMKLFELLLTNDEGMIAGDIDLVSIVNGPAIETTAMFFSKPKQMFFSNDSKQLIIGPAMRPDKTILQRDKKTGEIYSCFFSKETVEKCAQLFMKNGKGMRTNLQHSQMLPTNETKGIYCSESWLVEDPKCDKSAALGFKDVTAGDWFVAYKCDDKSMYEAIKANMNGFSLEGSFFQKNIEASHPEITVNMNDEEILAEIRRLLDM
jgi:hypothetical protein